jgi:hypothetical protein
VVYFFIPALPSPAQATRRRSRPASRSKCCVGRVRVTGSRLPVAASLGLCLANRRIDLDKPGRSVRPTRTSRRCTAPVRSGNKATTCVTALCGAIQPFQTTSAKSLCCGLAHYVFSFADQANGFVSAAIIMALQLPNMNPQNARGGFASPALSASQCIPIKLHSVL